MGIFALIYGMPITIVLFVIGMFLYALGLRFQETKCNKLRKTTAILISVLFSMPLNILGALYLAGVAKYIFEDLQTYGVSLSTFYRMAEYGYMFFILGTLNVISPIGVLGFGADTFMLHEAVIAFVILFVFNFLNSKRIVKFYRKMGGSDQRRKKVE